MSARRRRNIFQTRDQRFNYRFGSPAMRKRYRVRSKRRLIIAVCILLVFLALAGAILLHLFRDISKPDSAPADSAAPAATTEQTQPQETEQQTAPAALSPVAVAARELAAAPAAGTPPESTVKALLGTPHDTVTNLVNTRRSDWHLILVNQWHLIPEDFTVDTLTLLNGLDIDVRAADDLDQMFDACVEAGHYPVIASAYRSHDYQQQLFDEERYYWINEGYSEDEAYAKAAESIAIPGTSEHECGLAVDIVDGYYQETDEQQGDTDTQKWLMEHCWEYGFILRYPPEKKEITGIIYEPWHYRYVGREYAKEMHDKGLCLEEFVWMTDHPEETAESKSE